MYCNTTVGSLPLGFSRRLLAHCSRALLAPLMVFCGLVFFNSPALTAQSTAGGGIHGTVTDPSGAAVANAQVTVTNTSTGVATTQNTNRSGLYTIQPLQVGDYNVEVVAKGFQRLLQQNVSIDNQAMVTYNPKLTVGGENTTITVTDEPPYLNTTDASLGGTIENELYSQLPLNMNGGPRDPTAFQYLMPGVQENPADATGGGAANGNSGIYGGTGQTNLNENYIDGVPVSNISQQGSSNPVSNAVSVDAVDQFSVTTSGASVSFGGAGSANYTIKSGGNQFHGDVFDYIRNTAFDTWGYFGKVPLATGTAIKPGEHQNNYGGTLSGPILKDKLFFFGSYEGYHYTKISNTPQYVTIPTLAERTGDFTDVFGTAAPYIFDPTHGSFGSRPPFGGLKNGVPTNNVIPSSEISSISQNLEAALPQPTNLGTFSNYLASLPEQATDYKISARLDYTLNSRNKFTLEGAGGLVGYHPFYTGNTPYNQLPIPYARGIYQNQKVSNGIFKYTYIASQTVINTFTYGYTRSWGAGFSLTSGTPNNSAAAGITNLPVGNASNSMPQITWRQSLGPTAPAEWYSSPDTGASADNSYFASDIVQWIKGRHNFQIGAQIQWEQANGASYGGYSNVLQLSYSDTDTGNCVTSSVISCQQNGHAFASFLVGAVYSGTVQTQAITDVGARYRPMAPFIQDNWQVSPKLTLNLGLRYDYLQPYHEVHDRIAFLNTTTTNPITGTPGVLEYAGFPDANTSAVNLPYICHCTTPVHPYEKNLEPRVGFSYAYTPTTVFAGGFSLNLTHAGGVGGNANAVTGPGNNNEFSQSNATTQNGTTSDPAFFLNPSLQSNAPAQITPPTQGTQPYQVTGLGPQIPCVAAGTCSPYSAVPPWQLPGPQVNPLATTGNYNYANYFPDFNNDYNCQKTGTSFCQPGGVNYADPYYGGRGPQYITYNFSVQKMINKQAVLTLAYSGSQTHFLPHGAGRGYATNTYSPDYLQQYKSQLTANGFAGTAPPFPGYSGTYATVGKSLSPFPQYGTMNDIWGDTANSSYNSFQVTIVQRPWHNLSGFMNYTRAKGVDDAGNHRTFYGVGPQDGNFTRNYTANQVDRGLSSSNQTNAMNITWIYNLPIGRGQAFFATNRWASLIGGGWQVSGIYRYRDGYPLQVTGPSCNAGTNGGQGDPNAHGGTGICMPDYTPGFDKRQVRINGKWGRGPGANAANINTIRYLNTQAFECPDSSPLNVSFSCGNTNSPTATWKLGNVARSAADGVYLPGWWDVDMGIVRTFNVRETATLHLTFQVRADVTNLTNSTFFNVASQQWNTSASAAYGTIGGQNQNVQPRDWQFQGRFRF